jgi:hypothetical protein
MFSPQCDELRVAAAVQEKQLEQRELSGAVQRYHLQKE